LELRFSTKITWKSLEVNVSTGLSGSIAIYFNSLWDMTEPDCQVGGKSGILVNARKFREMDNIEADMAPAIAQQRHCGDYRA
jgi:hypothetical protein